MQFIDLNDNSVTTLSEIRREWADAHREDPENTAPDFKTEIFEILMATVNGRNDLEIIGMTPRETDSLIHRLRAQAVK
jgi:hypothetical protein